MTWAIKPQPMTPTLSRLAIFTPFEYAGTFHRPYTKPSGVSTPWPLPGAGEHSGGLWNAFLRSDERVLVLDRDGVQTPALSQRDHEFSPPRGVATPTHHGEIPRHRIGWARPAPVEQPVEGEVLRRERDVFAVTVADRVANRVHHRHRVHAHPEEVAWVDVGRDRIAERGDSLERLDVVHDGAGMKLEADEELRMLAHCEFRDP